MFYANSTFRCRSRRWLLLLSLCFGCGVPLRAIETPLPSGNQFRVQVENATAETESQNYRSVGWYGGGDEPGEGAVYADGASVGDGSTSTMDFSLDQSAEGESGIYPGLFSVNVYRETGSLGPEELIARYDIPYRTNAEGTQYYVSTASDDSKYLIDDKHGIDEGAGGMTLAEFQGTTTEQNAQQLKMLDETKPVVEDMSAQGNSDANAVKSAIEELGRLPVVETSSVSESSSPLSVTFPAGIGTISFDPMSHYSEVIPWIKQLLTWGLMLVWWWWVWKEFSYLMRDAGASQQAKGNTFAGTGGQITALIGAGLIAVVMVGVPLTYWAITTESPPVPTNPLNSGPGVVQVALYLVGLLFPYDLAIYLVGISFTLMQAKTVLLATVQAIVRAIVP